MKQILGFLLAVAVLSSPAHARGDLKQTADQVSALVAAHGDKLSERDRHYVQRQLVSILYVFRDSGVGAAPTRNLICDSNNNQLHDLDAGKMIYDFAALDACQEAMNNVKLGKPFCDYNDNTLRRSTDGGMIYDFGNAEDCRSTIERVYQGKNFCDFNDNTLRRPDGTMVYDFSNAEDCKRAMN